MKKIIIAVIGISVMIAGGLLWVAYRQFSIPKGNVLGVETSRAFWQDGMLLLTGENGNTLKSWDKQGGFNEVEELRGKQVESVAVAPDSQRAVVSVRDGRYSVLWLYIEGAKPEFLAALQGNVEHMEFSSNGRYIAFIERHSNTSGKSERVSVFDMEHSTIQSVSGEALSFAWIAGPEALIVVDAQRQAWYREVELDGRLSAPMLLGTTRSNVVARQQKREIIYINTAENGIAGLYAMEVSTGKQAIITELGQWDDNRTALLRADPSRTQIAMIASVQDDPASRMSLINLQTGQVENIPSSASDLRWISDTECLIRRDTGTGAELWNADIPSLSVSPLLTEGRNLFAL